MSGPAVAVEGASIAASASAATAIATAGASAADAVTTTFTAASGSLAVAGAAAGAVAVAAGAAGNGLSDGAKNANVGGGEDQSLWNQHAPPLGRVLAGAIGGPICIFTFTPLRNALTLAAKDPRPALALYGATVQRGWRHGWTGGITPTIVSSPQFVCMGPLYHAYAAILGSAPAALLASGISEAMISYGSQTRNAQMAFNAQQPAELQIKNLQKPWDILHVGFPVHVLRNMLALSGVRIISPKIRTGLESRLGEQKAQSVSVQFGADLSASVVAAWLSMPANQLWSYLACTETRTQSFPRECLGFLRRQYFTESGSLSPRVGRDLFLRAMYVAPVMSTFTLLERVMHQWMDQEH